MRVALDAMGGDNAPAVPVRGGVAALAHIEADFELVLVGDPEAIDYELRNLNYPRERLSVVPASQVIEMGDPPVESVRRRPDSSIVRGVKLQEKGEADAFISAGSTGAMLAASMLVLGPLPSLDRPAIGVLLPTASDHPTLMLDGGANVDSKPDQLVQFAHLGHIFVQDLQGRASPRIGLLNIGEEPEKGNELTTEVYRLLEASALNFIGNVEGRHIITGDCDVVVCDGFVGNIVLKIYESVADFVGQLLGRAVAHARERVDLENVLRVLDYTEYGGAPLLGVDGVTIICHGHAPPRAIQNAVGVAIRAVESEMVKHLTRELSELASKGV